MGWAGLAGWAGWADLTVAFIFIKENNTAPESRILSQFRTPPNASTLEGAPLFAYFRVDPKCLDFSAVTHKSSRVSRFVFEVA